MYHKIYNLHEDPKTRHVFIAPTARYNTVSYATHDGVALGIAKMTENVILCGRTLSARNAARSTKSSKGSLFAP